MPEQYFDPVGLTEPNTTPYTLTVYNPPRTSSRWLPSFLRSRSITSEKSSSAYMTLLDETDPNPDCSKPEHLRDLPTKTITIKAFLFAPELRCMHLQQGATVCNQGCYFRERGGDESTRWRCERADCEGHMYCGLVLKDDNGKACFGEKAPIYEKNTAAAAPIPANADTMVTMGAAAPDKAMPGREADELPSRCGSCAAR
ncbi:predicted protein [Plenodomus lingam JN3]|uniref:Uncharacterized protein n=1 Tax=Leptosphaeria maculans (strain JN3 / isolate v23.1.3 / race Av1-4-5-6-7-8) TaxID=985895 RepID=E5A7L4_LEPMJ|nr:predicted protein [Plenodomus lingam JN3]CBX99609.1 predicted protein [Plenodomus lingam JN3]